MGIADLNAVSDADGFLNGKNEPADDLAEQGLGAESHADGKGAS